MKDILIGPFAQLLTLRDLPFKGALRDEQLEVIQLGGIWISEGLIKEVGFFAEMRSRLQDQVSLCFVDQDAVCIPAFVDCHTHIAFAGNRANDFALRNAGSSYLEIAEAGGGIWSTVKHTRAASQQQLQEYIVDRAESLLEQGITTIEVKSGYGLTLDEELKTLRAIKEANSTCAADLVATCLAAHMLPKDYVGTAEAYLADIAAHLFPVLLSEQLTNRIDAFIERSAFSTREIQSYLEIAKSKGFDITIHADQFTVGGSQVAIAFEAVSADHLEASTAAEIAQLAQSDVVAVALPAASLGLGCAFAPARQLLDAGAGLAIASDWNPGSAPMGRLMESASILATMQKLSNAEVLAAITFRAAKALHLSDRGRLVPGQVADFLIYPTNNYQNITYLQGSLHPCSVWKSGNEVFVNNRI